MVTKYLTTSTQRSLARESDTFSASEEIPHILRKTNIHSRVHNSHPLISVLSHMNSFHANYYEGWNFNSGNYLFTTDTK